jgi:hypothetical protein
MKRRIQSGAVVTTPFSGAGSRGPTKPTSNHSEVTFILSQMRRRLNLPPASSRNQNRGAGCLDFLPLFNCRAIETPVASDPEARKPALAQQPVNGRRMHAQMVRQLFYGEDFILSGHRSAPWPAAQISSPERSPLTKNSVVNRFVCRVSRVKHIVGGLKLAESKTAQNSANLPCRTPE